MDIWWGVFVFVVGFILGYICPIGRGRKKKVVGTLYVTPPEEKGGDPYLYLQISSYDGVFNDLTRYALFKVVHKRE